MTEREFTSFSLSARAKSFGFAFAGIAFMLKSQHNAWVHLFAAVAVVVLSLAFHLSYDDWRWIIVAISIVWIAEAFNTAIESICDLVSPEQNNLVKQAKDVGAGAVLLSAIAAAVIGVITFWRYL